MAKRNGNGWRKLVLGIVATVLAGGVIAAIADRNGVERRITAVETAQTFIGETVGEIKADVKTLLGRKGGGDD